MNIGLPEHVIERALIDEDIPDCVSLWVDRMGSGFENRELLREASNPSSLVIGKTVFDPVSNKVIGFCIGVISPLGDAVSIPWEIVSEQLSYSKAHAVGVIHTVVVDEAFENQGIGGFLSERIGERLSETGVPLLLESWNREQDLDGQCIAGKLRLAHVVTLSDYWSYTTSETENCVECGQSPCECSGSLYLTSTH